MLTLAAASATYAANTPRPHRQPQAPSLSRNCRNWTRSGCAARACPTCIEDAEDDFFRLYNKLNKKNDFDVLCGYVHLDRDSLAMSRTCLPYFLGYYSVVYSDSIPEAGTSMCIGGGRYITATVDRTPPTGYLQHQCHFGRGFGSVLRQSSAPTLIRMPVNAAQPGMRQEYIRNIMRAIYRDQRLLEKANALQVVPGNEVGPGHVHQGQGRGRARKAEERRLRRERRGSSEQRRKPWSTDLTRSNQQVCKPQVWRGRILSSSPIYAHNAHRSEQSRAARANSGSQGRNPRLEREVRRSESRNPLYPGCGHSGLPDRPPAATIRD